MGGKGKTLGKPDYRAEFGEFTPNKSINESIHRCLLSLPEGAARRIAKKIQHEAAGSDPKAPLHSFRELIVGAYLAEQGSVVDYERNVEAKTPDWSVLGDDDRVTCIVDVFTLNPNEGKGDLHTRIIQKIDEKAGNYKDVARRLEIPFVAAMYGSFFVGLYDDEVAELSRTKDISEDRQTLSGVFFMEDKHYFLRGVPGLHSRYRLHYFANASAAFPCGLKGGDWYREPSHRSRAHEASSVPV